MLRIQTRSAGAGLGTSTVDIQSTRGFVRLPDPFSLEIRPPYFTNISHVDDQSDLGFSGSDA